MNATKWKKFVWTITKSTIIFLLNRMKFTKFISLEYFWPRSSNIHFINIFIIFNPLLPGGIHRCHFKLLIAWESRAARRLCDWLACSEWADPPIRGLCCDWLACGKWADPSMRGLCCDWFTMRREPLLNSVVPTWVMKSEQLIFSSLTL